MKNFKSFWQKLITIALLSTGVTAVLASRTYAEVLQVNSEDIKAYWVMPLSSRLDVNASWIEIVSHQKLVRRIPATQLNYLGTLNADFGSDGMLRLTFQENGSTSTAITLATQERVGGWYPPVELCLDTGQRADCKLDFTIDTAERGLSMHVIFAK